MAELNVTFDQMLEVYDRGIIGTREFREWLAHVHPTFATVRDPDVDEAIVSRAEYNQRLMDMTVANIQETA